MPGQNAQAGNQARSVRSAKTQEAGHSKVREYCPHCGSRLVRAAVIGSNLVICSADCEWMAAEREVDEQIQRGEFEEFDNMEDFLESLG